AAPPARRGRALDRGGPGLQRVRRDPIARRARRHAEAVLGAAMLVLALTTIVGVAGAPWILQVIAPGFTSDRAQADLAVLLTRVMFPYLPLVGLAALAMGVLQIHGRFFAASIGPALSNL